MIKRVVEISSEKIKLSKNAPPIPDIAQFEMKENDGGWLYPSIESITFIYKEKHPRSNELMEWVRQYSYSVTGHTPPPKEKLVFDGLFEINEKTLHIHNMLLGTCDFTGGINGEDITGISMTLFYEDFYWKI